MNGVSEHQERFDVVVVGAGSAGANTALAFARRGRSVCLIDERGPGLGGARWSNGVVEWQFRRAGLPAPQPPIALGTATSISMISPSGSQRFSVDDSPIIDVDMRELTADLWRRCARSGVEFRWRTRLAHVELSRGRPTTIVCEDRDGQLRRFSARLFVDATGLAAELRHRVPSLAAACPRPGVTDLCSARQLVFHVASTAGARDFLIEHGVKAGAAVDFMSPAGGFSVEVIRIDPDLSEVSVLVGTLGDRSPDDAASMMARLRESHPWIGAPIFGGGGLIPLRRPYDRLGAAGVALVGDAASQVMAGHGSGVGYGLMAGTMLAEAATRHDDIGSVEATWEYQSNYHQEFGAILAGYDLFRRYTSMIGSDGVERLFRAGLFDGQLASPGLHQTLGTIPVAHLPRRLLALARNRDVAKQLIPTLARMQAARAVYAMYPRTVSPRKLARWSKLATKVCDDAFRTATPLDTSRRVRVDLSSKSSPARL